MQPETMDFPTLVTVTLNSAVDKTYIVPGFSLDAVYRPIRTKTTAGGKGINVARVYHTLGGHAVATGFLGGMNGRFLAERMEEEGIAADFVPVADESRLAIAVLDPDAGTQTEVNENGPNIRNDEFAALLEKVSALLSAPHKPLYLALSGSLPPSVPNGTYAELIALANRNGVRVALDGSGKALQQGAAAKPFLVKPNVHEAAALGVTVNDWSDAPKAARDLRERLDAEMVLLTGGAQGAVLANRTTVWRADAPQIEVVSAVGSGDSLLAAFLWGLVTGPGNDARALGLGVAAGAANATVEGAGFCTAEQILSLSGTINVEQVY